MKAARFYQVGHPLVLEEVPQPQPGTGEVLIRVKSCGICGSDIHIVYEGGHPDRLSAHYPGPRIQRGNSRGRRGWPSWRVGDRVAVNCIVSCERCSNCLSGNEQICLQRRLLGIHLNGGLADVVVPARNLAWLPNQVPFDQGAVLTDAVATPHHALTRRGRLSPGESVAVWGCGGLGLHAVQLAKLLGAGPVIALDVSEVALERARERGAMWSAGLIGKTFWRSSNRPPEAGGWICPWSASDFEHHRLGRPGLEDRRPGRDRGPGVGEHRHPAPHRVCPPGAIPARLLRLHHPGNRRTDRLGGGRKAGPLRLDFPTDSTGSRQSGIRGPASKDR